MSLRNFAAALAVSGLGVMGPTVAGATPVTIGFENLGVPAFNNLPYSGSQEGGFDIAVSGTTTAVNSSFLTAPPLVDTYLSNAAPGTTTLTVTELVATTAFRFVSIDIFSNGAGTPTAVTVEGFLGATSVGTDSFTQPATTGGTNAAVNLLNKSIDSLEITFISGATVSPQIDNIALDTDPAAPQVPVPAAGLLLLGGIGAMGVLRMRKTA